MCCIPCLKKNVQPVACYKFGTHERILTCFRRNAANKVRNQKVLYYTTSNNLCFCISWQNGKCKNCIFHLLYKCIAGIQLYLLLDFFNLFDSWLIRCCMTPWILYQCVQLGPFGGHGSGERKSRVLQQLDCVACPMHQCAVFWVSSFAR